MLSIWKVVKDITKKLNSNKRLKFSILLLVFIFLIFIRLFLIDVDSPIPVPADAAFRTDQGWFSHNALNKIQTDDWFFVEDRNEITHTFLYSYIQYFNFKIFGVKYSVAKFQSILFSLLSVIFLSLFYKKFLSHNFYLIFLFLTLLNYFYLVYSQAALTRTPVTE